MKRLFAVCVAMMLPLTSSAQQAWGDEGGCARVLGKPVATDLVFVLWPDRIERHESSCRIIDMRGDLNFQFTVETECSGEGETWTDAYRFAVFGDSLLVSPADYPDIQFELQVCE